MRFGLVLALCLVTAGADGAAAAPPPAKAAAPAAGKAPDALFASLAKASSAEEAKPIEDEILAFFLQSGSASVDLLMQRAAQTLGAGDMTAAKQILDSVTGIAPDYAEGWHQRARLLAASGDDEGAMLGFQKTVTLNPRQFEAYAELAGMLEEYGNKPAALSMYRKALKLDPNLGGVARHVRELTRAIEGERI